MKAFHTNQDEINQRNCFVDYEFQLFPAKLYLYSHSVNVAEIQWSSQKVCITLSPSVMSGNRSFPYRGSFACSAETGLLRGFKVL